MSRVAKKPIEKPASTELSFNQGVVTVKGKGGTLTQIIHPFVDVTIEDSYVKVHPKRDDKSSWMHAGTARSLINNMVIGVSQGFEKKLQLVGVGYRAQAKGKNLTLTVGYSHPVEINIPDAISVETPSQTEIVLKSANKQILGQIAANIRSVRPPEPYKGKGIRYSDETVRRKEAKKK